MATDYGAMLIKQIEAYNNLQKRIELEKEKEAKKRTFDVGNLLSGLLKTMGASQNGLNLTPLLASAMGEGARANSGSDKDYGGMLLKAMDDLPIAEPSAPGANPMTKSLPKGLPYESPVAGPQAGPGYGAMGGAQKFVNSLRGNQQTGLPTLPQPGPQGPGIGGMNLRAPFEGSMKDSFPGPTGRDIPQDPWEIRIPPSFDRGAAEALAPREDTSIMAKLQSILGGAGDMLGGAGDFLSKAGSNAAKAFPMTKIQSDEEKAYNKAFASGDFDKTYTKSGNEFATELKYKTGDTAVDAEKLKNWEKKNRKLDQEYDKKEYTDVDATQFKKLTTEYKEIVEDMPEVIKYVPIIWQQPNQEAMQTALSKLPSWKAILTIVNPGKSGTDVSEPDISSPEYFEAYKKFTAVRTLMNYELKLRSNPDGLKAFKNEIVAAFEKRT